MSTSTGATNVYRRYGSLALAALLICGVITVVGLSIARRHTPPPDQAAPGPAPEGMVWVPGGSKRLGTDQGKTNEGPAYAAIVAGFWLNRSPVTVAEFAAFQKAGGYQTSADKLGSGEVMQFGTGRWQLVPGANWLHPFGTSGDTAKPEHPVTQVSWYDAKAYCQTHNWRLPTEAEWEYAARYGHPANDIYAFGSQLVEAGDYHANVWTGTFPGINTAADGYARTSPVGAYGSGPLGLTDMAGNVWEWSADWYRQRPGIASSLPDAHTQKTLRGGSYLCSAKICHGFRITGRTHASPDSSLMQVGFRCAADAGTRQGDKR